jgi:hypothetical protein
MLTDTFAGISPGSVPPFVIAQFAGGLAACALGRLWFPTVHAADLVVPRDPSAAGEVA